MRKKRADTEVTTASTSDERFPDGLYRAWIKAGGSWIVVGHFETPKEAKLAADFA